jgi:hypothetical protein
MQFMSVEIVTRPLQIKDINKLSVLYLSMFTTLTKVKINMTMLMNTSQCLLWVKVFKLLFRKSDSILILLSTKCSIGLTLIHT